MGTLVNIFCPDTGARWRVPVNSSWEPFELVNNLEEKGVVSLADIICVRYLRLYNLLHPY